jgi:glycerol-3-phosphate acyltransferase PlsY
MYFFYLFLAILTGYLSGSVSFAVIICRLVSGKEIRKIGNLNPGTMNVLRNIGKGWGILVGFLDTLKSFTPVLIARLLLFTTNHYADVLALFAIGIVAIIGHRFPIFYRFIGGKGAAPLFGVFLFFIPFEFLTSFVLAVIIILVFIRNVEFRWGRWVPILVITITPFYTLLLNYFINIPLFAHISIGGHDWPYIVGVFATSLIILSINLAFMRSRVDEYKESKTDS